MVCFDKPHIEDIFWETVLSVSVWAEIHLKPHSSLQLLQRAAKIEYITFFPFYQFCFKQIDQLVSSPILKWFQFKEACFKTLIMAGHYCLVKHLHVIYIYIETLKPSLEDGINIPRGQRKVSLPNCCSAWDRICTGTRWRWETWETWIERFRWHNVLKEHLLQRCGWQMWCFFL